MPIRFITPEPDAAEAIARVHVACWREAYAGIVPSSILDHVDMADRVARWRGYLQNGENLTVLAADEDGTVAGFINAGTPGEQLVPEADGHIFALYILARHHRRGIGRRLIGRTAAAWAARGGRALSVGVLTAKTPARAFYEALGARFVRPDVYHWHGHALDESIYVFDNLSELASGA